MTLARAIFHEVIASKAWLGGREGAVLKSDYWDMNCRQQGPTHVPKLSRRQTYLICPVLEKGREV